MNKPDQVRELLENAVPHLKRNPDSLHIFVEAGSVYATGAGLNLSFEYQFNLVIVATDYPEHADRIIVPLLAWCRTNQPELLMNPDRRNGFRFRAEQLNHTTCDIEITLQLTERVCVTKVDGGVNVEHLPEPPDYDDDPTIDWELIWLKEGIDG